MIYLKDLLEKIPMQVPLRQRLGFAHINCQQVLV